MTELTEASETNGDLKTVLSISTICAVIVGVVVGYSHYALIGGASELFKGMNLALPFITKIMLSWIGYLVAPALTVLAIVLSSVLKPVQAVKGQATLILILLGFSVTTAYSFYIPLLMLYENLN
jgi:type II secretory pathway component PulF